MTGKIKGWVHGVYWWWWFRFAAGVTAIGIYNTTYHPHGFVATWIVGIGVGVATAFALDGCRAGYRREKRLRDAGRARELR